MSLVLRKFLSLIIILLFIGFASQFLKVYGEDPTPTVTETPTPTPTPTPSVCTPSVKECSDKGLNCTQCEQFLKDKIGQLKGQEKTLSSQIAVMDNQMRLTQLRINSTKQQIKDLTEDIETTTKKIGSLEESLTNITKVLINRVITTYEVGSIQPFHILLSSEGVSNFLQRLNYLKIAQAHDKKVIYETQQAKVDYANEKEIFEGKKAKVETLKKELEGYTAQIEQEKVEKQELLRVTKNDEEMYQKLLAQVLAERAIVSGGGKELFLRNVNAGDSIATVITGQSGCSTGTHLHFSIYQGLSMRDPNDYLSSKSFTYSYGPDLYGYYGTINPHGSYPWPLDDPIEVNQGFGSHGYASRYPGGVHDGIDIEGGSLTVKAVRSGKLYQGSYSGCSYGSLNFAKVEHDDGLITWYLHVIAD